MNPGKLDRRIDLHTQTTTISASGERVPSWSAIAKDIAAAKRETSGTEANANGQEYATAYVIFTVRFRESFTAADRIVFNGTAYDVLFVQETGRRNQYLDIITQVKK